jgi:hypothetical protein
MNPEFEGDVPVNPFDMWKGCNFKLRIRNVDGYRNFDQSSFDPPSTIPGGDENLEKIWKSEYSLKEFLAPDQFKSYDDLKKRLNEVLVLEDNAVVLPPTKTASASAPVTRKEDAFASASKRMSVPSDMGDDDDEDLKAFKALADD